MRQVWIINHYASEPGGVGGTRHYQLARGLRDQGWHATVIASSVELNSGRQRLRAGETKRIEVYDTVPFLWIRVPGYVGNGGGRLKNMLSFAVRVLMPGSTRELPRPDVIVGSSVHPFAAASAALLAKRNGVPFVFEVRDLWPQTLIDLGRIRAGGLLARLMGLLELWLYRKAQAIVVVLPKAGDYIASLGIDPGKVTWIPNGIDLTSHPATVAPIKNEADRSFTLMYFGAHGQANALATVIEAIALINERDSASRVRLRMIGDGPLKKELMELAKVRGLESSALTFEAPVPKNLIPALASEADAFVLSVLDRPQLYRYGISMNKLFDYMAAGRPVLIASAAANNPVQDACCGITVAPEDPVLMAEAIQRMAAMPDDELRAMGLRGRQHVEANYSFVQLAQKFAEVLSKCAEARDP